MCSICLLKYSSAASLRTTYHSAPLHLSCMQRVEWESMHSKTLSHGRVIRIKVMVATPWNSYNVPACYQSVQSQCVVVAIIRKQYNYICTCS